MYKLGVLGFGKMGQSIINGVIASKLYNKEDIIIFDPNKDNVISNGFNYANNEFDVYQNVEMILFAIKPQSFPEVLEKLKVSSKKPNIIISIAAGITLDYLENNLGPHKYVRIMPNLSAAILEAVSTMALSKAVTDDDAKKVKEIFDSIGTCEIVSEDLINVLLPLNGSYPAYFWYFLRSFIRFAVKEGANYEQAKNMVANASIGCAKMLLQSPKDLDTLIKDVCSYKGTTIEGVNVFDDKNLDDIIDECSKKCMLRAIELEKK